MEGYFREKRPTIAGGRRGRFIPSSLPTYTSHPIPILFYSINITLPKSDDPEPATPGPEVPIFYFFHFIYFQQAPSVVRAEAELIISFVVERVVGKVRLLEQGDMMMALVMSYRNKCGYGAGAVRCGAVRCSSLCIPRRFFLGMLPLYSRFFRS